jgi:hypothetical protein
LTTHKKDCGVTFIILMNLPRARIHFQHYRFWNWMGQLNKVGSSLRSSTFLRLVYETRMPIRVTRASGVFQACASFSCTGPVSGENPQS